MSSQKRIDSSRANGAKSHGPATPLGRARSCAASLTHGPTASQLLLEGESEEQFNAPREEHLAEYQPQTRSPFDLVDQLVAARWRLNRVLALQTALIDRQIARQEPEIREEYMVCDGETRGGIAYLDAPPKNQKLHDEPSDAKPLHSDEDTVGAKLHYPPSTIDHAPTRMGTARPPPSPSTIHHRPTRIDGCRCRARKSKIA